MFAYLMRRKAVFFGEFLKDFKFLENRNNIYESSSLKEFFRQCFQIFTLFMPTQAIMDNRPFAAKPSRDLLFIKLWAIT